MERRISYFDHPDGDRPLGSLGAIRRQASGDAADAPAAIEPSPRHAPQPATTPIAPPFAAPQAKPDARPAANSPAQFPAQSPAQPPVPAELTALRWMVNIFFVAFAVLRVLDVCGVRITLASELSLMLGGLVVIAHMAATVIGTTRRNAAPDEPAADREAWLAKRRRLQARRASARLPSPTTLREDHPAGRWVLACLITGALAAALVMAAVTFPTWSRIGLLGVLILELSAATIGSYFGYMAGQLTATARRAWTEATTELSRRGRESQM